MRGNPLHSMHGEDVNVSRSRHWLQGKTYRVILVASGVLLIGLGVLLITEGAQTLQ